MSRTSGQSPSVIVSISNDIVLSVGPTFRLTRAARSHDTPERGNTGHARARPVRRVQPGVIRLVERGLLTDEAQDAGSDVRFTPGRRATPAAPASFASANTRAMVALGGSVLRIGARRVTRLRC